jgi:TolA-binding protein
MTPPLDWTAAPAAVRALVEGERREAHEWEQRHETTRQALEAMRRRAIQAEMQLEVEQRKIEQLQQQLKMDTNHESHPDHRDTLQGV